MNAGRFAAVYAALRTGHDLGDHVLQTDAQAAGKGDGNRRRWVPAMAGHVGSYTAAQATAVAAADQVLGLRLRPQSVAAALAVSAGTHAFIDRRWPVRRLMEATGSREFATGTFTPGVALPQRISPATMRPAPWPVPLHGPYHADQALHHTAVFFAALVAVWGRR